MSPEHKRAHFQSLAAFKISSGVSRTMMASGSDQQAGLEAQHRDLRAIEVTAELSGVDEKDRRLI
jgi:hypothetical protein